MEHPTKMLLKLYYLVSFDLAQASLVEHVHKESLHISHIERTFLLDIVIFHELVDPEVYYV